MEDKIDSTFRFDCQSARCVYMCVCNLIEVEGKRK
jgi:hypothetical protein